MFASGCCVSRILTAFSKAHLRLIAYCDFACILRNDFPCETKYTISEHCDEVKIIFLLVYKSEILNWWNVFSSTVGHI